MSPWRAVIVDSIDDLERNAANALLKNLEEPPPSSVFFLVSHAPERLLPTIRSRCRLLRLSSARRRRHDVSPARLASRRGRRAKSRIWPPAGNGSPGRALAWRGLDVAALDRAMAELVREGDPGQCPPLRARPEPRPQVRPAALRGLPRPGALGHRRRGEGAARPGAGRRARRPGSAPRASPSSARGLSLEPESVVFELAGMLASLAPSR